VQAQERRTASARPNKAADHTQHLRSLDLFFASRMARRKIVILGKCVSVPDRRSLLVVRTSIKVAIRSLRCGWVTSGSIHRHRPCHLGRTRFAPTAQERFVFDIEPMPLSFVDQCLGSCCSSVSVINRVSWGWAEWQSGWALRGLAWLALFSWGSRLGIVSASWLNRIP